MIVQEVPPAILTRYCQVARRIMLRWMSPNNCVGGTNVTCACLSLLGFDVQPLPVKFVVEIKELNTAFVSGCTDEELDGCKVLPFGLDGDWSGHLVALVNNQWIVDSSFDQADIAFGGLLGIDKQCFIFPLPGPLTDQHFSVSYHTMFKQMNGLIHYFTTTDMTWKTSPAWNDEAVPALARSIVARL